MYLDNKKYYDKNGNEVDKLVALDDKNIKTKNTIDVTKGTLKGDKNKTTSGIKYSTYFSNNADNMNLLFNFLDFNTNVEWSLVSDKKNSWLTTSNSRDTEAGGVSLLSSLLSEDDYTKYTHKHNHPNGSITPSGLDGKDNKNGGNDMKMKRFYEKYYPGRVTFYIQAKGKTVKF